MRVRVSQSYFEPMSWYHEAITAPGWGAIPGVATICSLYIATFTQYTDQES